MHNELTVSDYKLELASARIIVKEVLEMAQKLSLVVDDVNSREGIVALQGLLAAIKGVETWALAIEANRP